MAISFIRASGQNSVSSTSLTYSFDATGCDFLVVVCYDNNQNGITGVTYNAVSMINVASYNQGSVAERWYVLKAPTTGSNNVVVSRR